MSSNMNNISTTSFKNICRTCLFNCDLKTIHQDDLIIEILHKLTGVRFETNDELPQQICRKCFEKIHEIHAFSLRCKQSNSNLMKCLNEFKNQRLKEETYESIEIKEEVLTDEFKFEFVQVDELNPTNLDVDDDEKNQQNIIAEINNELNKNDNNQIKKTYKCDNCNKTFIQLSAFAKHKNIDKKCDKTCNSQNQIINNKLVCSGERPITCESCNKSFKTKALLRDHRATHSFERPFLCDICAKTFKLSTQLKKHKKTHNNEYLFKCNQCPKSFNTDFYLKRHIKRHSGERPFTCSTCSKTYITKDDLKLHEIVHSGERPYQCRICNKTFNDPRILKKHLNVHSGERPHTCNICEKMYRSATALIYHEKIHKGELPFECDVCLKKFRVLQLLTRHKRIHSGERPYKCDVCNEGFIDTSQLKWHKRIHDEKYKKLHRINLNKK